MSLDIALSAALYWVWILAQPIVYASAALMLCFGVVLLLLNFSARLGSP